MNTIHLINPMWECAGSEWRTYELSRLLAPRARVHVWSQARPSAHFQALLPIRRIRPELLRFPMGGTLVFVGVYARIGRWLHFARPRRTVVVYNTEAPLQLERQVRHIVRCTGRAPELVFASDWLRRSVGGEGPVQVSPIDLGRFSPVSEHHRQSRPFTIGRHSRDAAKKHHPTDPELYRRLAAEGIRVRALGGTVLASELGLETGVAELLPLNAERPEEFLRSLDCFYYRTSDGFREPHSRGVQEAMACGLPVVAHRNGGYAEYLDHGRNGFLFDTPEEAAALILRLRADPALRRQVGAEARATVEHLFSPSGLEQVVEFYLGR